MPLELVRIESHDFLMAISVSYFAPPGNQNPAIGKNQASVQFLTFSPSVPTAQ